jgi:hypothetical protein
MDEFVRRVVEASAAELEEIDAAGIRTVVPKPPLGYRLRYDRLAAEHAALVAAVREAYGITQRSVLGRGAVKLTMVQDVLRDALPKEG